MPSHCLLIISSLSSHYLLIIFSLSSHYLPQSVARLWNKARRKQSTAADTYKGDEGSGGAKGGGAGKGSGGGKGNGGSGHDYTREPGDVAPIDVSRVDELLNQRHAAKRAREFPTADALRDSLRAMGVEVMDREKQWRVRPPARALNSALTWVAKPSADEHALHASAHHGALLPTGTEAFGGRCDDGSRAGSTAAPDGL